MTRGVLSSLSLPFVVLCIGLLFACSSNYDREYKDSTSLPPLDVPPDLTEPDWNQRMAIPSRGGDKVSALETNQREISGTQQTPVVNSETMVLPEFQDVKVLRDGNVRWLEMKASGEALWPELRAFWKEQNISLSKDEPALGLMETEWHEERGGLPKYGLQGLLSRVSDYIKDSGVRDRYHVRLERVANGVTNVYITVQRAELIGDMAAEDPSLGWQLVPPNPELEANILTKLMVFLGSTKAEAEKQVAAETNLTTATVLASEDGVPVLKIKDTFNSVWRRTGVALDRAGLYVEQQNRAEGIYYFTYTGNGKNKKGFFSKLFSGNEGLEVNKVYEVHLRQQGDEVVITAHNSSEEGQRDTEEDAQQPKTQPKPLDPKAAEIILERLNESYNIGDGSYA